MMMERRAPAAGRIGAAWLMGVALLALEATLTAAFPRSSGYINDFAGILDAGTRAELESLVRETEQQTSAEIAVATVTALDGMTVEQYANGLFHEWGIGKKDKENGVLVLVAPSERRVRIEVGYGIEPILPDGLAGEIIRSEILPRFKNNDYSGGTLAGVRRIAAIVRGDHVLTAEERARLVDPVPVRAGPLTLLTAPLDGPPMLLMIPLFGLLIGFGALMVGAGIKARSVGPVVFGVLFGGIPLLLSFWPLVNTPAWIMGPLAAGMGVLGYRKARRESPTWSMGSSSPVASSDAAWSSSDSSDSPSSSSSSDSSNSSDFGGGDSGGGGASGSW